ncbi:hypothetical protein, partial [Teichococcus deserti]|uniref:hypothetical protein n=1 Tax=Teichococcus deserti TaxID=1817963 RepID=UPI001A96F47A
EQRLRLLGAQPRHRLGRRDARLRQEAAVARLRAEQAQALLGTASAWASGQASGRMGGRIGEIAFRCGFGSEAAMRRALRRWGGVGATPGPSASGEAALARAALGGTP